MNVCLPESLVNSRRERRVTNRLVSNVVQHIVICGNEGLYICKGCHNCD